MSFNVIRSQNSQQPTKSNCENFSKIFPFFSNISRQINNFLTYLFERISIDGIYSPISSEIDASFLQHLSNSDINKQINNFSEFYSPKNDEYKNKGALYKINFEFFDDENCGQKENSEKNVLTDSFSIINNDYRNFLPKIKDENLNDYTIKPLVKNTKKPNTPQNTLSKDFLCSFVDEEKTIFLEDYSENIISKDKHINEDLKSIETNVTVPFQKSVIPIEKLNIWDNCAKSKYLNLVKRTQMIDEQPLRNVEITKNFNIGNDLSFPLDHTMISDNCLKHLNVDFEKLEAQFNLQQKSFFKENSKINSEYDFSYVLDIIDCEYAELLQKQKKQFYDKKNKRNNKKASIKNKKHIEDNELNQRLCNFYMTTIKQCEYFEKSASESEINDDSIKINSARRFIGLSFNQICSTKQQINKQTQKLISQIESARNDLHFFEQTLNFIAIKIVNFSKTKLINSPKSLTYSIGELLSSFCNHEQKIEMFLLTQIFLEDLTTFIICPDLLFINSKYLNVTTYSIFEQNKICSLARLFSGWLYSIVLTSKTKEFSKSKKRIVTNNFAQNQFSIILGIDNQYFKKFSVINNNQTQSIICEIRYDILIEFLEIASYAMQLNNRTKYDKFMDILEENLNTIINLRQQCKIQSHLEEYKSNKRKIVDPSKQKYAIKDNQISQTNVLKIYKSDKKST